MKIELNQEIYSYDALKIAKNVVDKNDNIVINKKGNLIEITLKNGDEKLMNIFLNEALAQQCRIDILKNNSNITEMITTLAIVNALNPKGGKK